MTEKRIKNSLDPYLILRLETINTPDEISYLMDNIQNMLTSEEMSKFNDVLAADVSPILDYIVINRSFLSELEFIMNKCGLKYKSTNIIDELWNSTDIDFFLKHFKPDDDFEFDFNFMYEKYYLVLEILKVVVESKYTIDDVLDKISQSGYDSLNELNLYILNK